MEFSGYNNANLLFNDSSSQMPRESLDSIFEQHDEGHFVLAREPHRSSKHAEDFFRNGLQIVGNDTEIVAETMDQHKYSRLASSSYEPEGLRDEKFSYIEDLKDFEIDESLSTKDNLVLHNELTGETHVSYRGTTDKISKHFFKDWKVNGEIAGGSTHTKRVKEAQKQFDLVVEKYGKNNLTVSGHSQGGHVSYEMGVRNDVAGHHFNPAINTTQVREADRYANNLSEQMIYKQPLDFASPLAFHKNLTKSNTKLNIVKNIEGMDGVVETHSIDQFAPTPKSIEGGLVKVERRTLAGSVVKGAGHIAGVGLTAYNFAEDVKKDKTAMDVGVDVVKTGEEYVVDGEIIAGGLALAPETMGLSLVASLGMVVVNDLVAEHTADVVKKDLPRVLNKTGNSISRWFKKHF